MTEQETMTIREMCDAYDVTPRTLRFYEAKELLFPIREGTRRLFTRRDRARLKLILKGKKFGVSLEQIRQLLDIYDEGKGVEAQLRAARIVATERLEEMKTQRAALTDAIDDLQEQISWADDELAEIDRKKPAAE